MTNSHFQNGFISYLIAATCAFLATFFIASRIIARRQSVSNFTRISRALIAGGFVIGAVTHLENWLRAGLVPAPDQPFAFNLFWSSLLFVDPLIALSIILWFRPGIVLAIIIMIADLTINMMVLLQNRFSISTGWPFYSQCIFFVFINVVMRRCWNESATKPRAI